MTARPTHALERHIALAGFMGAGKTTLGLELARELGREFVDVDAEIEREQGMPIARIFADRGEGAFRALEEERIGAALKGGEPAVVALGGGALGSEETRKRLRARAFTILVDVEVEEAWRRVGEPGTDGPATSAADSGGLGERSAVTRPLAQDEESFRRLYEERQPLYLEYSDAVCTDVEDAILAAGGVEVSSGALALLGELVPGAAVTGAGGSAEGAGGGEGGAAGAGAGASERRVALVVDENVRRLYGPAVGMALGARLASMHELPAGEAAKSFEVYQRLLEELRLERRDLIVALGGGCTTDTGGFAAATYMRGIDWVSVPTSLVGQADAGLGGKTAIDLASGKNLVGAFHWPARVVVDPGLLGTLPERERREGMAEVVKTGLLAGERLWELPDAELVRGCALHKLKVCLRDPRERGLRATLNLGHTFAHALEVAGDYGRPTHGEAVALGLVAALRLSIERYGLDKEWLEAVEQTLRPEPVAVDRERAWAALYRDKKVAGGTPRFVLLEAAGKPLWGVELEEDEARGALDELISSS